MPCPSKSVQQITGWRVIHHTPAAVTSYIYHQLPGGRPVCVRRRSPKINTYSCWRLVECAQRLALRPRANVQLYTQGWSVWWPFTVLVGPNYTPTPRPFTLDADHA